MKRVAIMRKKPVTARLCGMTLIEVTIAMFILAMCLSGVFTLLLQSRQLVDRARAHYTAINMAKNRIEEARGQEFNTLAGFRQTNVPVDTFYRVSTAVSNKTTNLIEMIVTVDIMNRRNSRFTGEKEVMSSYFTQYIKKPGT